MKPILFFLLIICCCSCNTTKIYIVRHAEKNGTAPNADLKVPEGINRANTLRDSLYSVSIKGVYSTNVPRTLHTGEPTATDHGMTVTVYANGDSLVDQLVTRKNKRYLVVGHSNTVPQMIRHLGLDPGIPGDIPDNDFDNLYVITVTRNNGAAHYTIVRKTYGAASP